MRLGPYEIVPILRAVLADPRLLNTYAVVGNRPGSRSDDAIAFMNWLARGAGRRIIDDHRIRGKRDASLLACGWRMAATSRTVLRALSPQP